MAKPVVAGILGSAWGYCIGCAVIWAIRILGTLGFGKEAMGLGDVHLMGAVGAVLGAPLVSVAIVVAALYGTGWGIVPLLLKRSRALPFGPFLSLGSLTVIVFHDRIGEWIAAYAADMSLLFGG